MYIHYICTYIIYVHTLYISLLHLCSIRPSPCTGPHNTLAVSIKICATTPRTDTHTPTPTHTHSCTHTHTQDVESKRTLAAMCMARGYAPPSFATGPHHWAVLDHCPFAHSLSAAGILSLSLSLSHSFSLSLFSSLFSSLSLLLSLSSSLSLSLSLPLILFLSLFLFLSLSLFLSSLPHSLTLSLYIYMYNTTYVLLRHHSVTLSAGASTWRAY